MHVNRTACRRLTALLLPLLMLTVLATLSGSAAAQTLDQAAQATGRTVLTLQFDREPVQEGLSFRRERIVPGSVRLGGASGTTEPVWTAQPGSGPEGAIRRTVDIQVTDPRFLDGKMPIVDIEVTYQKNSQATTELFCDTAKGLERVASRFGANANSYLTLSARLNNARFGKDATGTPHLRLTSANDLNIRRIVVTGYDRDNAVDYARLLPLEKIESTGRSDGLLLLHPGRRETVKATFHNLARRAVNAAYTVSLTDPAGKVRVRKSGTLPVPGEAQAAFSVPVETNGFRFGVYTLRLEVAEAGPGVDRPILTRESYIGVISETRLPKAKDGEFLYGLDVAYGAFYDRPPLLAWTDVMGADIVRHGFNTDTVEEVTKNLPIYERHGLRILYNLGIPYEADAARRRKRFAEQARRGEEIARRFGQFRYWELGNEPDLPFFYAGPIDDYVTGMAEVYRGIKQGNKRTVVMNGGLSFAHQIGKERSRRFLELVDPATLDALAYHGHGPGAQSERAAYERMRRTAREFRKDGLKPYVETESGVAARTRTQEEMQARTAVQKLVYAQGERLPLFIWFRLLMFSEDYGNLRTEHEPRPAVLTYRATVEQLRGLRFARTVDTGKEGIEAYLFADPTSGKRVCVLWSSDDSDRAQTGVALTVAPRPDAIRRPLLRDMYGNALSSPTGAARSGAGDLIATVGKEPLFLSWETRAPSFAVRAARVLQTAPEVPLAPGTDSVLTVSIRNPYPRPITVRVDAKVPPGAPGVLTGAPTRRIKLPAQGVARAQWKLRPAPADAGFRWPEQWSLFLFPAPTLDLAAVSELPKSLPGAAGDGAMTPRIVRPAATGDIIDFVREGGKRQTREPAVVFAEVYSDTDRSVTMGASADYWMEWYVNGRPVFDTLKTGNGGGYSITDHTFALPLRRGKNLIAARVLSGSMGSKLLIGAPAQVAQALRPELQNAEYLTLTVAEEPVGKGAVSALLAREIVRLRPSAPILTLPAGENPLATLAALRTTAPPDITLTGDTVQNLFAKEPDATRWWKGAADFSAQVWLRADASHIYLLAAVRDDTLAPGAAKGELSDSDSLQVAVASAGDDPAGIALTTVGSPGGGTVVQTTGKAGSPAAQATVTRQAAEGITLYSVAIPRPAAATVAEYLNFQITDSDGYGRKQLLTWRPGWGDRAEGQPVNALKWHRLIYEK